MVNRQVLVKEMLKIKGKNISDFKKKWSNLVRCPLSVKVNKLLDLQSLTPDQKAKRLSFISDI